MSVIVAGFVKNGVVVPNAPLPEGAFVEVHVIHGPIEVPPELQAELDAWQLASAGALELVERLAREGEDDGVPDRPDSTDRLMVNGGDPRANSIADRDHDSAWPPP